jgi:hypothetical protein
MQPPAKFRYAVFHENAIDALVKATTWAICAEVL